MNILFELGEFMRRNVKLIILVVMNFYSCKTVENSVEGVDNCPYHSLFRFLSLCIKLSFDCMLKFLNITVRLLIS